MLILKMVKLVVWSGGRSEGRLKEMVLMAVCEIEGGVDKMLMA